MNLELRSEKMKADATRMVALCEEAFGERDWVAELQSDLEHAVATWDRIATGRGMMFPTIAFVGEVNSGKSRLIQLMILDQELATRVAQVGDAIRTDKLVWIGPESPGDMDDAVEKHVRVSVDGFVDLGGPFQILDTPGFGDVRHECGEMARIALSSARIKVLVVRQDRIRDADLHDFIEDGDGAVIVPVLNFCRGTAEEQAESIRALREKLQTCAPRAQFAEVICLPDFEVAAGHEADLVEQARMRLAMGLRETLTQHRSGALATGDQELRIAWQRFAARVAQSLDRKLAPLASHLDELRQVLPEFPTYVVDHLFADQSKVRILLKAQFRGALMEQVPMLAFPFRSMVGVLAFTAGAWDRLILGFSGSLPSLLMTGFAAAKGQLASQDAKRQLSDELHAALTVRVRESILAPLRALRRQIDSDPTRISDSDPVGFEISGLDNLVATWREKIRSVSDESKVRRSTVLLASLMGTGAFWFLLGAPLLHLYGQYVPAALETWSGDWSTDGLLAYPSLGGGFWMTAIFLSILPALFVAMLCVASALSPKRTKCAELLLRKEMEEWANSEQGTLAVDLQEPRLKAIWALQVERHRACWESDLESRTTV